MKRVFVVLYLLPMLALFSCGHNQAISPQNNETKREVSVDSLAIALHELDSLLHCGTLCHLDVYEIGKIKSVAVSVHKLTVSKDDYLYIN